ncbi:MAG: glycosyltransferase family 39 protein [Anaerostipes sp.]|jgi:hypothetical protein
MKDKIEKTWMKYLILWIVLIVSYLFVRVTKMSQGTIQVLMALSIIVIVAMALFQLGNRKLEIKDIMFYLIIMGLIMRIGYMLYTFFQVRSHDMWDVSLDASGHAAYILNIIEKGQLPKTNDLQFYQQPFFYLAGSLVSKIVNGILSSQALTYYVDGAKLVSCFASCGILIHIPELCKVVKLKEKGTIAVTALVAFLPSMYLSGGRVNPDMLGVYFVFMALLYTFYWMEDQTWKHTVILAVIYGLGMMTKISCGIMAIVTAGVFIYKLWIAGKEKKAVPLIKKYLVFVCISFPLGLWYSLRNFVKFGQSIMYVLDVSKDKILYVGDVSMIKRFITISIENIIKTPYASAIDDSNYPVYLLKSALFGEFTFKISSLIPHLLLFAEILLVLMMLFVIIWSFVKKGWGIELKIILLFSMVLYASNVWFNIKYPFGCSMDFRYLIPLGITVPILFAKGMDMMDNKQWNVAAWICIGMYSFLSCVMYLMISS